MKYIGIDPGKETGFAVWDHDAKYLAEVDTMSITQAHGEGADDGRHTRP